MFRIYLELNIVITSFFLQFVSEILELPTVKYFAVTVIFPLAL